MAPRNFFAAGSGSGDSKAVSRKPATTVNQWLPHCHEHCVLTTHALQRCCAFSPCARPVRKSARPPSKKLSKDTAPPHHSSCASARSSKCA